MDGAICIFVFLPVAAVLLLAVMLRSHALKTRQAEWERTLKMHDARQQQQWQEEGRMLQPSALSQLGHVSVPTVAGLPPQADRRPLATGAIHIRGRASGGRAGRSIIEQHELSTRMSEAAPTRRSSRQLQCAGGAARLL